MQKKKMAIIILSAVSLVIVILIVFDTLNSINNLGY